MSKATELARAEADRAEAEQPTDPATEGDAQAEPATDPETGGEVEPPDEPDEPEAKSKRSRKTEPSDQDIFEGLVADFRDKMRAFFQVDDIAMSEIPGVVGVLFPGFDEPRTHPDFTRCLTCNGRGKVLTGSTKPPDDEATCPDQRCKGRGYWQRGAVQPVPQPTTAAVTGPTVYTEPQGAPNGGNDWAEAPAWMGDPRVTAGG